MSSSTHRRERSEAAIWQEVEFGSYDADLSLWEELAAAADGPVLELGAGAGRVALELAAKGHRVIALDNDGGLAEELAQVAEDHELSVTALGADLTVPAQLELPLAPALVIGPLHVIQMIEPPSRPPLLTRLTELVAPGATIALTVVDESTLLSSGTAASRILPDMRELDGWVYSSEPLWVQVGDEMLTIRRLRERVSPDGRMDRRIHDEILHRVSAEQLEAEAREAGLRPAGLRQISAGANEADSTAVLLEAT